MMEIEEKELKRPLTKSDSEGEYEKLSWGKKVLFWWVWPFLQASRTSPMSESDLMQTPKDFFTSKQRFHYDGNLRNSLKKAFSGKLLWLGFQGAILSALDFLFPLYILYIESFVASHRPLYEGLLSLCLISLGIALRALLTSRQNLHLLQLKLNIKSTLLELIYTMTLRMKEGLEGGKAVNVMQVDAAKIYETVPWAVYICYYPFHFLAAVLLLLYLMSFTALLGLLIFFVLFSFNYFVEKSIHRLNLVIMKDRDVRLKNTTELLSNIRPLKLACWEDAIAERVIESRETEGKKLGLYMRLRAVSICSMWASSGVVAVCMFLFHVHVLHQPLTIAIAFGTTSTLYLLQIPLREIPASLSHLNHAFASSTRIDEYLRNEQVEDHSEWKDRGNRGEVGMQDASFGYRQAGEPVLKGLTWRCGKGEFVAVVGKVGSGKSSLLKAIIGEMSLLSGTYTTSGSLSYSGSIDSWILNTTVRENITIGREFNEARYNSVLEACALLPDLKALPAGDMTEIGERGINLSGGQKARVALARGVYADADIYLLDDPLGAVDAHVRAHIFNVCFLSLLRDKTRILVTHSLEFLSHIDRILTLSDGQLQEDQGLGVNISPNEDPHPSSLHSQPAVTTSGRLIKDEERRHGAVPWAIYRSYIDFAGGVPVAVLVVTVISGWVVSRVIADLALKSWAEGGGWKFELGFDVLSGVSVVCIFFRVYLLAVGGVKASQEVHRQAVWAVTRAPVNLYFDVTPLGRLLNRFSKDLFDMDQQLPFNFGSVLTSNATLIGILAVSAIYIPPVVVIAVGLFWMAEKCQKYYLAGSNNINRMLRNSTSPILHHFSESLTGLKYLRCLHLQSISTHTLQNYVARSNTIAFNGAAANIWLNLILNGLSLVYFVGIIGALIVLHDHFSAGAIGLIISYLLPLPKAINNNTIFQLMLQTNMISMERVHQLTTVDSEAPMEKIEDTTLYAEWPTKGEIEFRDVSLRYRPASPIILKGISFHIHSHESIGIVGRTGSGKTSLTQALFRIVEVHKGRIEIDGVDTKLVGLRKLRDAMTLIPQDPLLFTGTLQDNIDPFHKLSSDRLAHALESVGLGHFPLDCRIAELGSNLSSGEKQLICIARATVKHNAIVVLDEATSAVDPKTDALIQDLMRTRFGMCTVLTIAHRLGTVMKSDRILVMEDGQVREFDTPSALLSTPSSLFSQLVRELRGSIV